MKVVSVGDEVDHPIENIILIKTKKYCALNEFTIAPGLNH